MPMSSWKRRPNRVKDQIQARSHLLVLSARSETALDRATHRLREFSKSNAPVNMDDVAYTLQVGRKAFSHRRILICSGPG